MYNFAFSAMKWRRRRRNGFRHRWLDIGWHGAGTALKFEKYVSATAVRCGNTSLRVYWRIETKIGGKRVKPAAGCFICITFLFARRALLSKDNSKVNLNLFVTYNKRQFVLLETSARNVIYYNTGKVRNSDTGCAHR